jgi:hypothetical protein
VEGVVELPQPRDHPVRKLEQEVVPLVVPRYQAARDEITGLFLPPARRSLDSAVLY